MLIVPTVSCIRRCDSRMNGICCLRGSVSTCITSTMKGIGSHVVRVVMTWQRDREGGGVISRGTGRWREVVSVHEWVQCPLPQRCCCYTDGSTRLHSSIIPLIPIATTSMYTEQVTLTNKSLLSYIHTDNNHGYQCYSRTGISGKWGSQELI